MESIKLVRARTTDKISRRFDRLLESRVRDDIYNAKSGTPADVALQAVKA